MGNLAAVTLDSAIRTDRKLLQNASNNITLRDVEGYTKKVIHVSPNAACTPFTVTASTPERYVNKVLQSQVRLENSILSSQQALDDYFQSVETLFGSKGSHSNFATDLSNLANALNSVGANPDPVMKANVVSQAIALVNNLTAGANQIQNLRTTADNEIGTLVTECNSAVQKVAQLNGDIYKLAFINQDITNFEDTRDVFIHKLTGNLNIPIITDSNNQISLGLSNGSHLVLDTTASAFHFNTAPVASPGTTLSPIFLNGVDITSEITGGRLHGLLKMRDTILPNLQSQLDELTRHLRDDLNAIHNLGTSSTPIQTLTGTAGVPGLNGVLQGTTVVSGNGTLRLAALDAGGTIGGYTDIVLGPNTTVTALIGQINNAVFTGGGVAVTASLTPAGQLQLTTQGGYGVSIGSPTGNPALMGLGAAFNAGDSYGFSHFFGLNNLFETGPFLASSAPQTGVVNTLSVRADIKYNPNLVSCSQLSGAAVPPLTPQGGLPALNSSIMTRMANQLKQGEQVFLASGLLPQKTTTILDYSSLIIDSTQSFINNNSHDLEKNQLIYNNFSNAASAFSAVDPSEILVQILEIASSQNLTSKSLSILLDMDRDLAQTLTR